MKVKVLQEYEDRFTGKRVHKDSIIEVTKDRFNEINNAGYGDLLAIVINPVKGVKKVEAVKKIKADIK